MSEHVFMTVLMLRDKATMRAEFSTVTLALMSSSIASNAVRLSARSELHDMMAHLWYHNGDRGIRSGRTCHQATFTYFNAYQDKMVCIDPIIAHRSTSIPSAVRSEDGTF